MMTQDTPHPAVPAGATASGWDLTFDGIPCRSLEWSRHDTAGVGVGVDGFQSANGDVTRGISVYLNDQDLDAEAARALASKLVEAAEVLEGLL